MGLRRLSSAALALLCAFLLPLAAMATGLADEPAFEGDTAAAVGGKTLRYGVSICNNPGIAGYHLYVLFDTEVFSVQYSEEDKIVIDAAEPWQGSYTVREYDGFHGTGVEVVYSAAVNTDADGMLFALPLAVEESAALGAYPVSIVSVAKDVVDELGEPVTVTDIGGAITVESSEPAFVGIDDSARAGDCLRYTVAVKNNPGMTGFQLAIDCDTEVFCLAPAEEGEGLAITAGQVPAAFLSCTQREGGYLVTGFFGEEDVTDSGTLFSLDFLIAESATPSEAAFSLRCIDDNTLNADRETVAFSVSGGSIEILPPRTLTLSDGLIEGSTLHFTAENTDKGASARFLLSFYDSRGVLLSCRTQVLTLREGMNEVNVTCPAAWRTAKLFAFDDRFLPLCAVLEITKEG